MLKVNVKQVQSIGELLVMRQKSSPLHRETLHVGRAAYTSFSVNPLGVLEDRGEGFDSSRSPGLKDKLTQIKVPG